MVNEFLGCIKGYFNLVRFLTRIINNDIINN